MDYKLTKLTNGLRVLTVPMPSLESVTLSVWVKAGSRDEDNKVAGISHFLEHIYFKGGKKYSTAKMVSEAIDAVGGESNAGTSKEWTRYYIRIRAGLLEHAFDVLSDILLTPQLRQGDINREKGVIIEEMNMYEDTPIRRVWEIFEQTIFEGHPLGVDIIGTKESVSALAKSDFEKYRDVNYFSGNMLISVAGGVTEDQVTKLSEKYFGGLKKSGSTDKKLKKVEVVKPKLKLVSKKIEQAHFILGFPAAPMDLDKRYQDNILETVLGGGMSSRLFEEVREKRGLAYSVRADLDRSLDNGYFAVYAGVDPGKLEEAAKVILDQVYGLKSKKYEILKKEYEKTKEFLKGHLALSLEDTRSVSDFFAHDELLLGKVRTPEEAIEGLSKVKIDEVYESAEEIFNPKSLVLTIIGPFKSDSKFAKLLE